jgi:hypothetical protein
MLDMYVYIYIKKLHSWRSKWHQKTICNAELLAEAMAPAVKGQLQGV